MSEISTPKSLTSHVSYFTGITFTAELDGRMRFCGEGWPACSTGADALADAGSEARAFFEGVCGACRTSGSGGSVVVAVEAALRLVVELLLGSVPSLLGMSIGLSIGLCAVGG